jgi:hypothetical protein
MDGTSIAEPLLDEGMDIRRYRDFFKPAERDTIWIPQVAEKQWVIFTFDASQVRTPLELRQLYSSQAREFIIRGRNVTGAERARWIIKYRKRIEAICKSQQAPFVAYITKSGVEVRYSKRRMRELIYDAGGGKR